MAFKSYVKEWKEGNMSLIDAYVHLSNLLSRFRFQGLYTGKYIEFLEYEKAYLACKIMDSRLIAEGFNITNVRGWKEWVKVDSLDDFTIYRPNI